jgi:hypothetical protein
MRRRHVAALGEGEGRRTILLSRRTWALLLEPVACSFKWRRRRGGLLGHGRPGRQDRLLPTLELTADPLHAGGGRARHHHGEEREVRGDGGRGGSEEQGTELEMNRGRR